MTRIAVIADPHVHDCGWQPAGSGLAGAIRSYGDTAASTRVFNESLPAFRAALERALAEGARLVLLVGDLTDDGQAPNIDAALALIAHYRQRHGLRVLAVPGNHDFYALAGRPQDKTFLHPDGTPVLLRSAACPEAATLGTPEALRRMQMLGYLPEPGDLHWETPFGRDPDWQARHYRVTSPDGGSHCRMIDASYLVEPVPGLWVLAIDSNVCVPRDGARDLADPDSFHDPTGAGWAAVLGHRAHLLPWMRDVAARARAGGKRLLAFSHYPALDVLAGTGGAELRLLGPTGLARRTPPPEVAEAFAATGVALHLSGHLHVNDTARHGRAGQGFVNVSVPSPVGFCPAMKLIEPDGPRLRIRTLRLERVPGHDLAFAAYRAEAARAGQPVPPAARARDHGEFLDRHLVGLVHDRYVAREWPRGMADLLQHGRSGDLPAILGCALPAAPDFALWRLAEDWYRLRKGGGLALRHVAPERLDFYRRLGTAPRGDAPMAGMLAILGAYLARLPNLDFTLDLRDLSLSGH
ncbi:metallophosphoesterase [Paracoccus sp. (in: a-proteobacteria)]|uniref:metallophosphoesterase family protein n=1 Tax=Paracoccus sp. TaxID=267 RepID=UPI00322005B6